MRDPRTCVEINRRRPTPSTRRRPRDCVCSMAWRFHAKNRRCLRNCCGSMTWRLTKVSAIIPHRCARSRRDAVHQVAAGHAVVQPKVHGSSSDRRRQFRGERAEVARVVRDERRGGEGRAFEGGQRRALVACAEIKILRRVRAESSRRPPRHRRDACSTAWRCEFLTARPSQDGRVVAEKRLSEELSGAPDALVDFHTAPNQG